MTDKQQKAMYIARQLLDAGLTLSGAAGVIANIDAESAFKPNNVQDTFERGLCMNDEQYTAAVDNGTYTRFTTDGAGYGIAQWTARDRKENMLKFHRKRGASIGDFKTQVAWLCAELPGYAKAFQTVTQSNNPYLCGYNVCKYYEIPADTENAARYRGGLSEEWFAWLNKQELTQQQPEPDEPYLPARADLAVMQMQTIMRHDGYWNGPIDGIKTQEFREKLKKYAADVAAC